MTRTFRLIISVVAATVAAVLASMVVFQSASVAPAALLVIGPVAVFFGGPLLFDAVKTGRVTLFRAVGWGFVAGAGPTLLMVLFSLEARWPEIWNGIVFVSTIGGCGAVGGFAAWAAWHATSRQTKVAAGSALAIVCSAVIVLAIPAIIKDRSCHNLFLDGRSHARPVLVVYAQFQPQDWLRLRTIVSEFAAAEGLDFRDEEPAARLERIFWSFCKENGFVLRISQRPLLSGDPSQFPGIEDLQLSVFDLQDLNTWQPSILRLIERVESVLPARFVPMRGFAWPKAWAERDGVREFDEPDE